MPRVSVILTSFNHEKYIREAIDSVLNQTFTDFELIIWDDASADDSWTVINNYPDSRIKPFRNEVQKRGAYGINKAISEVASGEFIAIHHSDDVWELDKLEKQVEYLDAHPEIGALFTRVQVIDEDGNPFTEEGHFYLHVFEQPNRSRHEWLNHFFIHGNALCHPSILIRRACYLEVGLYDRRLAQIPDFEMWVRLCMKYDIHILENPLTRFRVRANEMNQSGDKPETHIRATVEYQLLFQTYLAIPSEEMLILIFPDIRIMTVPDSNNIHFLMARYAVEQVGYPQQYFGIRTLYELMHDSATVQDLEQRYGFSYHDLIRLTGEKDVFRIKELAHLQQTVANLQQTAARLNDEVIRFKASASWKITRPLRFLAYLWRRFARR